MEHRQNGRVVIEQKFPVRAFHGGADFRFQRVRLSAPLRAGLPLTLERLTAAVVRADVGGLAVLAPEGGHPAGIGPGGDGLRLQGLFLKTGGHLSPEHPGEIVRHGHGPDRAIVQYPERDGFVPLFRGDVGFFNLGRGGGRAAGFPGAVCSGVSGPGFRPGPGSGLRAVLSGRAFLRNVRRSGFRSGVLRRHGFRFLFCRSPETACRPGDSQREKKQHGGKGDGNHGGLSLPYGIPVSHGVLSPLRREMPIQCLL